jgi:hypothetical protein
VLVRDARRLRAIGDAELPIDLVQVELHGLVGEEELLVDVPFERLANDSRQVAWVDRLLDVRDGTSAQCRFGSSWRRAGRPGALVPRRRLPTTAKPSASAKTWLVALSISVWSSAMTTRLLEGAASICFRACQLGAIPPLTRSGQLFRRN